MNAKINLRYPIVALAILSLLIAMWGGLIRIDWQLPAGIEIIPRIHGPLMIAGFMGILIGLERAVALQRGWTYLGPIFNAIGTAILLASINSQLGILFVTLGSMMMLAMFIVMIRQHMALHSITMTLAVVVLVIGNLIWLDGNGVSRVVFWWAGFLILTIVGERLELSRVQRLDRRAHILYTIAVGIFMLGLMVNTAESFSWLTLSFDVGARILGLGLIALAAWLWRFDIARRTIRQRELTRFIAACLLAGYFWLIISGGTLLVFGSVISGPPYDAILHTIFIGFAMSMIFGHAPIVFPAVLNRALVYKPTFYIHLVLLHASLVVRILGDWARIDAVRQWGAMFNAIAILIFLIVTVMNIVQNARK